MAKTILSIILYSGCTIVSDGWSNVQRRPLINVMLVCPRGETFIKSIDSSSAIKSSAFITNALVNVIKEIGLEHAIQVMMDNAKNYRNAGDLMSINFPHNYANGYNAYILNLVLKDWYNSDKTICFSKPIDAARQMVKFILKQQRVLDMYRVCMSTMLKFPIDT